MVDNARVVTAIQLYLTGRIQRVNDLLASRGPFDISFDCELEAHFNEGMLAAYEDTLDVIPDIIRDYTDAQVIPLKG